MCIDPEAVFKPDDIFSLLESPHDTTGVLMMSSDLMHLTCGKLMENMIHESGNEYMKVDRIEPSFLLLRQIPEGWNFTDPLPGHVDTRLRVGNEVTVVV